MSCLMSQGDIASTGTMYFNRREGKKKVNNLNKVLRSCFSISYLKTKEQDFLYSFSSNI